MDSPGFPVITKGNTIRVVVPLFRMNHQTNFKFDAVTAYMQVNASKADLPMLGVYTVYSVASGKLSLPYQVSKLARVISISNHLKFNPYGNDLAKKS